MDRRREELRPALAAHAADVDLGGRRVGGEAGLVERAHVASLTRGLSSAETTSATRFEAV